LRPIRHHRQPLVGSTPLDAWTLLQTTDQGTAPFDPGGFTTTGTGFNASTGEFTWVFPIGGVTQIDGFKESMARWTVSVSALYGDYDPSIDILDLAMRYDSVPLSATVEKYGVAFGLFDRGTEDIPNLQGLMFGLYPNTSSAWNNGNLSASAAGANVCTGTPNLAVARFDAGADQTELRGGWRIRNSVGGFEEADPAAEAPPISGASLKIHIGHMHRSIVGIAGSTVVARLYHRRIRTAGLSGLPA